MELEVKILNIDKEEFINKIESLGAKFIEKSHQVAYTYDLPTLYGRYIDLLTQLNFPEDNLKFETAVSKLKLLFFELDNLLNNTQKETLKSITNENNFSSLIGKSNILEILNNNELISFVKNFHINPKKWIRLRQTNDKTTIAIKHILAPNDTNIQQMSETELVVSDIQTANSLLEALGFSYKCHQEKERISYILDDHPIDIDTWPGLPTYVEVEGKSEEDLKDFLFKLGYSLSDTVSCTVDEIYLQHGISILDRRELKFEDFE